MRSCRRGRAAPRSSRENDNGKEAKNGTSRTRHRRGEHLPGWRWHRLAARRDHARPAKFSLWIGGNGLSAAGTSIAKDQTVDANKSEDLYLDTPVESTEYLVGKADTAAALTVTVDRQREVI
jgi:hypothetical protein